ncbi:MAG: hypothetical protein U9O87_03505 [Verrucomicrobiota bacterium]|nr:hypothetical protein [Verrucomicrobiota bacterium]
MIDLRLPRDSPWAVIFRALPLLLLENEKGLIGGTFCQEAKSELTALITNHLFEKRNQAELEKNANGRSSGSGDFKHISPREPHHIWSIDYTLYLISGASRMYC